jgi:alpha-D-xyloside xylohydrolase
MLKRRTLNIVLVDEKHGNSVATANKVDKSIIYTGKALSVRI